MLRPHVHSFLQTLKLVCFLLFDIPKSMCMLINAEMTPKRRECSERANMLFDCVCHVCFVSWWKFKILINIYIYKEVV